MASQGQQSASPEGLADAVFGCLQQFTVAGGTSASSVNDTMERVFGLLAVVKKLPRQAKVQCVWRLSEHGAFPLIVAAMVPETATFSLACTFLGVTLEDDDLLSHRIGRTLTRDQQFLTATDTGLLIGTEPKRAETGLLVAQMVSNVLKSASASMMSQLAGFGSIARSLSAPLATAVNSLDTMDWRHPFVAADALFLFEASGACSGPLDDANVGEKALAVLKTAADPPTPAGAALRARPHLLQRVAAIGLLWLGRQKVVPDDLTGEVAKAAVAILGSGAVDLGAEQAKGNRHGAAHVLTALAALGRGDSSPHDACRDVLVSRVRDWAAIEAEALAKVRSPEFAAAAASARENSGAAAALPPTTDGTDAGSVATSSGIDRDPAFGTESGSGLTARERKAAERAAAAAASKESGNRLFKAKDYTGALKVYNKAAELLDEQQAEGGDIAAAADVELAKVWSNAAECYLRLEQYVEAVDAATDAIDADPSVVKAWHRRGRAHLALKQWAEARSDLTEASRLQTGVADDLLKQIPAPET